MRRTRTLGILVGVVSSSVMSPLAVARGQSPLAPLKSSGQSVTPAYEGWYKNADGTFSISFGYYNRNTEEALDIPIGPDNFVEPGNKNQGQPTHFEPRRHWGVFAVKVPANFGDKKVLWTVKIRGESYAIPGGLHPNWQIDALEGEAGSGNTPPSLRFSEKGPEGAGPGGITAAAPLAGSVGKPVTVTVWAMDDGKAVGSISRAGRAGQNATLMWFKHQGPGTVTFAPANPRPGPDGLASTTATFSEPGEYILRVRANDASGVAGAGHAQCCWSNGFVKVTVTR